MIFNGVNIMAKIKEITLGSTGITVPQNGFGALPVQRVDMDMASKLLRSAYEGGMRFFDTARAYSDSEEKIGYALSDVRENIIIATKSGAKDPDTLREHLETSLKLLKTEYIDIYQFHLAEQVYAPGDGTGMYEAMLEFKEKGLIKHIGVSAHKVGIAEDIIASGLYETLQYPLSYISTDREINLVSLCNEANMGYIAMKGLAGGLLNNPEACFAFMSQFDNVIPIWGIQKESELEDWLNFMDKPAVMTPELEEAIAKDKELLDHDFCRGCGYCMPCPKEITINQCARMSLMVRRAPSAAWTNDHWQEEMKKIETCIECRQCISKCPYELNTPELLKANYEDYKKILAGEITV